MELRSFLKSNFSFHGVLFDFYNEVLVLEIVFAIIWIPSFVFSTSEKCDSELFGAIRQNLPGGPNHVLRAILSTTESDRLQRLGTIDHAFVIRLAELSEIRNISLWNDRRSNSYLVWSRRSEGEWLPVRTVRGDRKVRIWDLEIR